MELFIIIWSVWLLSEILLNIFLRSGKKEKSNNDKGSNRIIWISAVAAISAGVLINMFFRIQISSNVLFSYLGLPLILFGMLVRFYSIISLGKYFTVDFTIRENHRIKKDGIYSFIRHPSYLGLILSFIGLGISMNNWLSTVVITLFITVAVINRIRIEEKMMLDIFGNEYSDYMKKTYCLLPWIY